MCCSSGLAKCFLVIINVLIFLLGALVLVIGFIAKYAQDVLIRWFSHVPDQLMKDIDQAWDIPSLLAEAAVMLILVGLFVFAVGFFGCCGAIKENKCLLGCYITIIGCIVAFEVATIIVVCIKTQGTEETVIEALQNSIRKNYFDSKGGLSFDEDGNFQFAIRPIKLAWDGIQVGLSCCGAINASDYVAAHFDGTYNFTMDGERLEVAEAKVPLSCCSFIDRAEYEKDREGYDPESESTFSSKNTKLKLMRTAKEAQSAVTECLTVLNSMYTNQKGCYKSFLELIEDYWAFFIGFLVCVIAIEVLALGCACTLCRHIGKGGYEKPVSKPL